MVTFKIIGKTKNISKEELRALLVASASVMEFHNMNTYGNVNEIKVKLVDVQYLNGNENVIGRANRKERRITIVSKLSFQEMLTTVLHEIIHIYMDMNGVSIEKCTSTLVSKLKHWVVDLYEVLMDEPYARAGYIAHTKISYKSNTKDYYDHDQYEKLMVDEVKKYRRNKEV